MTTERQARAANRFIFTDERHAAVLQTSRDFVPISSLPPAKFSGRVVFAGYGITAPEYHYDDYAGLDVKGKIVLVLRHEPQENDEQSVFAGKALTEHAAFHQQGQPTPRCTAPRR